MKRTIHDRYVPLAAAIEMQQQAGAAMKHHHSYFQIFSEGLNYKANFVIATNLLDEAERRSRYLPSLMHLRKLSP